MNELKIIGARAVARRKLDLLTPAEEARIVARIDALTDELARQGKVHPRTLCRAEFTPTPKSAAPKEPKQ